MTTITDIFNEIKADGFDLVHFSSADVIFTDPDGKVAVVWSRSGSPSDLQVHLYKSRQDYVDQKAISILGRYTSYKTALTVAHNYLKG